jgi:hypothetical protein
MCWAIWCIVATTGLAHVEYRYVIDDNVRDLLALCDSSLVGQYKTPLESLKAKLNEALCQDAANTEYRNNLRIWSFFKFLPSYFRDHDHAMSLLIKLVIPIGGYLGLIILGWLATWVIAGFKN